MISTEQLRKTIEECVQKRPSGQSVVFTSKFVEALARELLANRETQDAAKHLVANNNEDKKRITELEISETQLIEERDIAHDAIDAMYEAATGERPEWSNWFTFADAVEEVAGLREYQSALGSVVPEGFLLMPIEMTDEIGEAIAKEANCCGGIALCIYDAALKAAPEVSGE
ncbi:Uncharacterised protein [Serratia grimesii]|uniref:hypothetical protein n=1 Tax=Serratia grimesii TaxID=82995 RepID=UPI0021C4CEE5|nr:Uncharacterised protein [Serratia grimesii]